MNYEKIYRCLIERARNRDLEGYYETHHIIPRCLGGDNSKKNLVKLTPEEHYVAHQLLVKMHPENFSLVKAAQMMIPSRPSNKLYGWIRRRFSEAQRMAQLGEKNSQYGKVWIHNVSLRKSTRIYKEDPIPNGWEYGRVIDFDRQERLKKEKSIKLQKSLSKRKKTSSKRIKRKHNAFRKTEGYRRAKAKKLYKEFENSNLSLRKFADSVNMVPMTLSKWFREFIPEYDLKPRVKANKQLKK